MAGATTVEGLFERYGPVYRWYATATVMLGTMSVVLASTIINVAVPAIMVRFHVPVDEVQWLVTGFLAAMTVGMLLNAWAVARFGSSAAFQLAMGVFIVASVVGGISENFAVLVAARVVQGLMAGMIQPHALIAIFQVFPVHRRGQAMGIYGMGVIFGPAIAPGLGGVLVDAFSWRATFYVVLPALSSERRSTLDWFGLALLSVGLVATLWALASGRRRGWLEPLLLVALLGGPAVLAAFVLWQRRCSDPLFDLNVFKVPGFGGGFLISIAMGAGLFATTYLIPLYFQQVSGMSPAATGLMLMPAGIAMAAIFPLAGHLTDRASLQTLIGSGLLLFALSMGFMVWSRQTTAAVWLIGWAALTRLGLGMMMPPVTAGSLRLLPPELINRGSGVINFGRQFGGALGVNLSAVLAQYASDFFQKAHPAAAPSQIFEAGYDAAFLALGAVFLLAFWPLLRIPRSGR